MKQEKTTTEKIKATSHVLAVLFKVARILCFVAIGTISVGIVYVMLFGDMDLIILSGKVVVHSPFATFSLAGHSSWELIFMSCAGLVSFILLSFLFKQARDIFRDISQDSSPFELKHVKRIKKIAIFFFVISMLDLQSGGVTFSFTLNFIGIVGALMLWCISLIFEYGCQLQRESDETL